MAPTSPAAITNPKVDPPPIANEEITPEIPPQTPADAIAELLVSLRVINAMQTYRRVETGAATIPAIIIPTPKPTIPKRTAPPIANIPNPNTPPAIAVVSHAASQTKSTEYVLAVVSSGINCRSSATDAKGA